MGTYYVEGEFNRMALDIQYGALGFPRWLLLQN